ncbi:unnamed protein product [Scytosiphon promiscuus]
MEPMTAVPGFLGAVEVQAPNAASGPAAFHHAPSATSSTATVIALSGDTQLYTGSTALEAAAFLPSGAVDRSGSTGATFLDLPVQSASADTAAVAALPPPQDTPSQEICISTAPTLSGCKRSQPTGGWGSRAGDGGGGASSHGGVGPGVGRQESVEGDAANGRRQQHHHQQERPLGGNRSAEGAARPPSPSGFVRRGGDGALACSAAAVGGGQAGVVVYANTPAAGGAGSAVVTVGPATPADAADAADADAEENEMDHDVGESPMAFPLRSATRQDLGEVGVGELRMDFVAGAATAAADIPGAAAAAAAATATAAFAGTAAAAVGAVDGMADPVSCLGDYNFSFEELNKMSKRYPTVSTLRAQTPMPLLGWLTRELDMSQYDMRSLIMRHPRLMAYRVTSHVAPKTKWLRERLGLGQPALRKVRSWRKGRACRKTPRAETMLPVVHRVCVRNGPAWPPAQHHEEEKAPPLVTTYPAVLSRSVEKNLEPKFKWLEERLGASQEEVAVLIKRFPMIFGYSTTQNLEPTVAFFTADMSGEQHEIKSAVMSCPSILSRSLDKRMMPRTRRMQEKKIEPRFGPHKWVVSTYTDAQFTRWLEGRGS